MRNFFMWILVLFYWMVLTPIIWVMQGLLTPLELIVYCCKNNTTDPSGYMSALAEVVRDTYDNLVD